MLTLSSTPYTALPGFARSFAPGRLTLGLFYPIEAYSGDVPLRDPGFGDLGQIFDPFVYLGYLAARTSTIALGTGGIVVPLRHPLHLVKAATSVAPLHWRGGSLDGADMVPKPLAREVPLLVTGSSRQTLDWIAANAHGWITYPRPLAQLLALLERLQAIGINHVILSLKYSTRPAHEVIDELRRHVVPHFPALAS